MRKPAAECSDMAEIRAQVNDLDREILKLLGERLGYVKAAVTFKPTEESVRHPDHWGTFFAARRQWAALEGYDPDIIEAIYRKLYEFTIQVQLKMLP